MNRIVFNRTLIALCSLYFISCSPAKKIESSAQRYVLGNHALANAQVGISVYDPEANKYLYSYQGDKYFIPASNTKLATCYAAMKYLGDSLVGIYYGVPEEASYRDKTLIIAPAGDPTFLHPDFSRQPVSTFLNQKLIAEKRRLGVLNEEKGPSAWGAGWSWDDYESPDMAERSVMPIFGNVITIRLRDSVLRSSPDSSRGYPTRIYHPFTTRIPYFDSIVNGSLRTNFLTKPARPKMSLHRSLSTTHFILKPDSLEFTHLTVPFVTNGGFVAYKIISESTGKTFALVDCPMQNGACSWDSDEGDIGKLRIKEWKPVYSQPTDSVLKPMMHRSDNFFAEQMLLKVGHERFGTWDDQKIIDSILALNFSFMAQKPRWVDGSGLSRYNLFTPENFIAILNKMQNEFGMERIKTILPTGNDGTLSNYYRSEKEQIFAKTGTLSDVVALSGFLYRKNGKLLIFSILVNHHLSSVSEIRHAVESFVRSLRETK